MGADGSTGASPRRLSSHRYRLDKQVHYVVMKHL